jgi:hypothetical protein
MDFTLRQKRNDMVTVIADDPRWSAPLYSEQHGQAFFQSQSSNAAAYIMAQEMNKCADGSRLGDADFNELHEEMAKWLEQHLALDEANTEPDIDVLEEQKKAVMENDGDV